MKIELLKDVTNQTGSVMKAGLVCDVPDDIGRKLIAEGSAKERKPIGPTETKSTSPQPVEEPDDEPPDDDDDGDGDEEPDRPEMKG